MLIWVFCARNSSGHSFECQFISGDPNVIITCQISNDTGSNIQAVFRSH